MPYPFAHPAAVVPLCRPMGRFAVPSALAIGSVAPDLWYFAPQLTRLDSHSLPGLAWFCLPAGFLLYLLYHLLLKHPLIALLPERVSARAAAWTPRGLPPVPWTAVMLSLVVGTLTHLAWDSVTHASSTSMWLVPAMSDTLLSIGRYELNTYQLLQHASTVLGTAFVAWWSWRKLEQAPPPSRPVEPPLSGLARAGIAMTLLAVPAAAAYSAGFYAPEFDLVSLRGAVRTAGFAGLSALALAVVAYSALWHLFRTGRRRTR